MIERKAGKAMAYNPERPFLKAGTAAYPKCWKAPLIPDRGNLDHTRRAPVHGSICYRNGQRIGVYGVNIPIIYSLNRNPEP
jgi:hypothetical protein